MEDKQEVEQGKKKKEEEQKKAELEVKKGCKGCLTFIGIPILFLIILTLFIPEEKEKEKDSFDVEKAELLQQGLDFINTGKCFNFEDDLNKKINFDAVFGTYITEKAYPKGSVVPINPVPFNKKAWKKCFGRPKIKSVDEYGKMKFKTYFYKSIKANVRVQEPKKYIESFIFSFN